MTVVGMLSAQVPDDLADSTLVGEEDEDDKDEELEENPNGMVPWWDLCDGGIGCDAEAVVNRMWDW